MQADLNTAYQGRVTIFWIFDFSSALRAQQLPVGKIRAPGSALPMLHFF
jgi:hypothetical protein